MLRVLAHVRERHLVRAPRALDRQAVDLLRPRPALRACAGRSSASAAARRRRPRARRLLDRARSRRARRRAPPASRSVHELGVLVAGPPSTTQRPVAVAPEQRDELVLGDAREHGRVRDLVAVQVQDRQHRAVRPRVQELVRVPARRRAARSRPRRRRRRSDEQVGVVERRAVRVRERVAELAALVDRARRLGRDVARDAAGERELAEQPRMPSSSRPMCG